MKALLLSLLIALSVSSAGASEVETCPLSPEFFTNNKEGALTPQNRYDILHQNDSNASQVIK